MLFGKIEKQGSRKTISLLLIIALLMSFNSFVFAQGTSGEDQSTRRRLIGVGESTSDQAPSAQGKVRSIGDSSENVSRAPVEWSLTGSEIPYDPSTWNNNQLYLTTANCYAYALNIINNPHNRINFLTEIASK